MAELYLHLYCWTGLSRLLVVCITYIMKHPWALSTEISSLETVSIFISNSWFCPYLRRKNGGFVYCFFHTSRIQEDNCFAHMNTVDFSCSLCFNDEWVWAFGNCFARKLMMSLSSGLAAKHIAVSFRCRWFQSRWLCFQLCRCVSFCFRSWKQNSRE